MSALKKLLVGSAGLAAVIGAASPAAAQYYPNNGYGQGYGYNGYGNGYGNNVGNAVGQAINGVIAATRYGSYQYGNYGYGQSYGYGQQRIPANIAVDQCARAVEARLGGGGYNNGYNRGYGNYGGYNNGYNGGYSGYNSGGRVTGITNIESRNRGALRVFGVASRADGYNGRNWNAPQYSFSCKVDYSGRVTELDLDRSRGYRGW